MDARKHISHFALRFVRNNKKILTHGYSRVVVNCLVAAAKEGRHFSVVVTEGRPDTDGHTAARELRKEGIPVTLICDGAVGYIMEQVDYVLLGAEGIVENGGIINKVGSYQIAIVAKALQRPVYVAAECFKFARVFPLNQQGLRLARLIVSLALASFNLALLDVHPAGSSGDDSAMVKPSTDVEDKPLPN